MDDMTLREWAERENASYARAYIWFREGRIEGAHKKGDRIFVPSSATAPAPGMPPARICDECGAIIGRGDEDYPDNHWEWCSARTSETEEA